MAKDSTERAIAYLSNAVGTEALLPKIVAEHASGNMVLDPYCLAQLYCKEIQGPTALKDRYQALSGLLATWIGSDFEAKLSHITRAGKVNSLMLATQRMSFAHSQYKPVSVQEMREKLPSVVEKIRRGDMTRFVHLISAAHGYGVCLACGLMPTFSTMIPAKSITPFRMIITVDQSSAGNVADLLTKRRFQPNWYHVVGYCGQGSCAPDCSNCNLKVPVQYDHAWVVAQGEDGMCKVCAAKQLINVQRPKFTRLEQRRLRRLIIT